MCHVFCVYNSVFWSCQPSFFRSDPATFGDLLAGHDRSIRRVPVGHVLAQSDRKIGRILSRRLPACHVSARSRCGKSCGSRRRATCGPARTLSIEEVIVATIRSGRRGKCRPKNAVESVGQPRYGPAEALSDDNSQVLKDATPRRARQVGALDPMPSVCAVPAQHSAEVIFASIAFINVGKNRGIFGQHECDYGRLLGEFFGESCAPGSRDSLHDPNGENPESLCSLCQVPVRPVPVASKTIEEDEDSTALPDDLEDQPSEIEGKMDVEVTVERNVDCAANEHNPFYGTRGALNCLVTQGEVAIIEVQNLAEHARALNITPNDYRVLCRNGSLAAYTGFQVDEDCYLTTIVDGEIVVRRQSSKTTGIINALSSLDIYLQNDPDFRMYNIYGGLKNLLFEDSALGLVSPQHAELGHAVQSYIRLFENVEDCTNAGISTTTVDPNKGAIFTINIFMALAIAVYSIIRG